MTLTMMRPSFLSAAVAALLMALLASATAQAGSPGMVDQVSDADPATWNLTPNNVRNVQQDLGRDNVPVQVVAYGPGIGMLKMDSVVGPRIAEVMGAGIAVVACENTRKNFKLLRDDMLPKFGFRRAALDAAMLAGGNCIGRILRCRGHAAPQAPHATGQTVVAELAAIRGCAAAASRIVQA